MNFSTLSRLLITITNSIANLIINVKNEGHNIYNRKSKQDGPSLESSSNLNVTLRYLGPWDLGTP